MCFMIYQYLHHVLDYHDPIQDHQGQQPSFCPPLFFQEPKRFVVRMKNSQTDIRAREIPFSHCIEFYPSFRLLYHDATSLLYHDATRLLDHDDPTQDGFDDKVSCSSSSDDTVCK